MAPRLANRPQLGFGLLESLVALVILASAGTAMFSWINLNLDTVQRLRTRQAESVLREQMAAWVQTLNPPRQPEGTQTIASGLTVSWTSRPVQPLTPVAPLPGGTRTAFRIGLYEVEVVTPGPSGPVLWRGRRVGLERDAEPAIDPALRGLPRVSR